MKKIFLIVLATFFHLGADSSSSIRPAQPSAPDPTDIPFYLTPAYIEKRSKSPESIRHGEHPNWFVGSVFNFYDKRIFFDKDASGKPIRKKISEHAADNPKFGKVLLVIYYPNKKHKKQFVILGTYADPIARKKLLRKIQTFFGYNNGGALWLPERNAIIACPEGHIANNVYHLEDLEVVKKFDEWLINSMNC